MDTTERSPRVWREYAASSETLAGDLRCDAAIVGGGMTGVCLAYILGSRGFRVALFEEKTLAAGKTCRSTAKATVAHDRIYSTLTEKLSPEVSRKYASANLAGLAFYKEHLSAGVAERRDFYLYALHGETRLLKEYHAMRDNGITCEYLRGDTVPLPFDVKAAVCLRDQVQLDPVQFVQNLAAEGKFRYFEHTKAEYVSGNILRCGGHTVTADAIVFAVNYPVGIPGFKAPVKLSRKTSCALAFSHDGGFAFPEVMAYGIDGGYGYRYAPDRSLIVSGETHRGAPAPNAAERIQAAVEGFCPDAQLQESWTNNDTYTHDGIPYVGKVGGVYVACGYSAWGMTNAASAAVLLAEQIAGGEVWYGDIFDRGRNFMRGGGSEFTEHMETAMSGMMKTFSSAPVRKSAELLPGEGGIVLHRGKRIGGYCDKDGGLHFVSLRCPHLGCELEWNSVSKTWDCPCHGSRFSAEGACLSNPAGQGIGL